MAPVEHEYKPVKVFSSFIQADILMAKLALDGEGIRYEVTNETFSGLYPGADGMATMDIYVDQRDADRAREVLARQTEKREEP